MKPVALLASAALALASCGGDDDGISTAATEPKTQAAEPVSSVIELVAPHSGSNAYRFDKKRLTAKAGLVEIRLTNMEKHDVHNVRIQTGEKCCDRATGIGGTDSISAGQKGVARIKPESGTYWFLCSILGHYGGDTGKTKGRLVVS